MTNFSAILLQVLAGLSFSVTAMAGPIDIPVDPLRAQWVLHENQKSRQMLAGAGSIQRQIQARAAELAPRNLPPAVNFLGLDFFVAKGSLILAGKNGTADQVVVDAARLPAGASVTDFRLSPDGTKLAFGFAVFGTDWTTWEVIALPSLTHIAGPFYLKGMGVDEMSWDVDSSGLYYQNWVSAAEDQNAVRRPQIKHHLLEQGQRAGLHVANDQVVFEDAEFPRVNRYNSLPFDKDTLIVYRVQGAAEVPFSAYLVRGVSTGHLQTRALVSPQRHWGRFLGVAGNEILFRTSEVGSNYGVIAVDAATLKHRVLIGASTSEVLIEAQQIGDKLVLQYYGPHLENILRITDLGGRLLKTFRPHELGMPDFGTFSLLTGNYLSRAGYFTYSSVGLPPQTLRLDLATLSLTRLPAGDVDFDGNKIRMEVVLYPSADGKLIPMDVFTRRDLQNPPAFAYLYSYGNIGIANTPQYNRKFQLMLELGGLVALPHIRGGGEWGLDWQVAGVYQKWNSIEDLRFASRFLKQRFPSIQDRVVLSGRSYGGMMTFVEYTHHQRDFSLFTPVVGVSDPILNMTAEQGWWTVDDYGLTRDEHGKIVYDPLRLAYIRSWSPFEALPHLRTAKPLMAFSEQFDTRVGSWQTIRFIQALQAKFGPAAPVHMIELENGGHAAKAEFVDEATFVAQQYGIPKLMPMRH